MWKRLKYAWAGVIVLTGGVAMAVSAQAGSFVDTVHGLEQRLVDEGERSERLASQVRRFEEELGQRAIGLETLERAQRKVKQRVWERWGAWERAHRRVARARAYSEPGAAEDVGKLLSAAEPLAVREYREDLSVLAEITRERRRGARGLLQRAKLTVELAQSRSDEQKTRAEREVIVERARREEEELARDLEDARALLPRRLEMGVKNGTERDFHRLKGTLRPPISAPATHLYGPRKQRSSMSYVRHSGLTWEVSAGSEVRAAAEGLVAHAAPFKGYGKLVIIDHGGDYHTLYAHLSKLDVEVGQRVEKGDLVGSSGETGSFEGPKLYFELRHKGEPVDPSPWFLRL